MFTLNLTDADKAGIQCCYSKNRFEVYTQSGARLFTAMSAGELDKILDHHDIQNISFDKLGLMKYQTPFLN